VKTANGYYYFPLTGVIFRQKFPLCKGNLLLFAVASQRRALPSAAGKNGYIAEKIKNFPERKLLVGLRRVKNGVGRVFYVFIFSLKQVINFFFFVENILYSRKISWSLYFEKITEQILSFYFSFFIFFKRIMSKCKIALVAWFGFSPNWSSLCCAPNAPGRSGVLSEGHSA